jgi:hypothetical protein
MAMPLFRLGCSIKIARDLFLLNRVHVPGDCGQPYFAPVLVRFDLMEDWPPTWHLSIAVGEPSRFFSFDDFFYALVREPSATFLRDYGQVRNGMIQDNCVWSMPSSISSMTPGAVVLKNLGSLDAVTRGRGRLILLLSGRQQNSR